MQIYRAPRSALQRARDRCPAATLPEPRLQVAHNRTKKSTFGQKTYESPLRQATRRARAQVFLFIGDVPAIEHTPKIRGIIAPSCCVKIAKAFGRGVFPGKSDDNAAGAASLVLASSDRCRRGPPTRRRRFHLTHLFLFPARQPKQPITNPKFTWIRNSYLL